MPRSATNARVLPSAARAARHADDAAALLKAPAHPARLLVPGHGASCALDVPDAACCGRQEATP